MDVWVSVLYVPYALPVLMGLFSTDFTLLQILILSFVVLHTVMFKYSW